MKNALLAVTFATSAAIFGGALVPQLAVARTAASHAASVSSQSCPNYSTNCNQGPESITFSCAGLTVTGSHTGNTVVTCSESSAVNTSTCSGATVVVHGSNLDLTIPGASIFAIDPSTGASTQVSAITGSGGEYTICGGSVGGVLPGTGGAAR